MPMSVMRRSTCSLGCAASGSGTSGGGGGVGESVGDGRCGCGEGDCGCDCGVGDGDGEGDGGRGRPALAPALEAHTAGESAREPGDAADEAAAAVAMDVCGECVAVAACFEPEAEAGAQSHACAATSWSRRRRAGSTCSMRRIRFSHSAPHSI